MLSTSTLPGIAATTELFGRSRSARLWTVTIIALLVCAVVLMFARIDPFAAAWVPVSRWVVAFTGLDAPEPPTTERLTEVLTPREREVLALLAEGRSNTSIAETLYVSERTVDSHVTAIFGKLGLDRTADAKPTRAGRGGTAERRSRLGAKLRSGAGAGQRGS